MVDKGCLVRRQFFLSFSNICDVVTFVEIPCDVICVGFFSAHKGCSYCSNKECSGPRDRDSINFSLGFSEPRSGSIYVCSFITKFFEEQTRNHVRSNTLGKRSGKDLLLIHRSTSTCCGTVTIVSR